MGDPRQIIRRTLDLAPTLPLYPDGTPGVRDVDNSCHMFEFGAPGAIADCMGDGHYLCRECPHQRPETLDPPLDEFDR